MMYEQERTFPLAVLLEQMKQAMPQWHPFVQLDDGSKLWNKVASKFLFNELPHTNVRTMIDNFGFGPYQAFNSYGQTALIQQAKALDVLLKQLQSEAKALLKQTNFQPFKGYYDDVIAMRTSLFSATRDTIEQQQSLFRERQQQLTEKYPSHVRWEFDLLTPEQFVQEWNK